MAPKVLVDDVVIDNGIATDGVADEAMVSDVVADEGMVTNGMADVGVADEGIAGLGVEDLRVAVVGVADGGFAGLGVEEFVADDGVGAQEFVVDAGEGTEEVNVDAEVIVKTSVYKGKGIMLQESNPRRKRISRPRGNGIVIEENANPSLTDDSDSDSNCETEIHFGTHNTNHTDDGCDYNMYSDSESEYSDRTVDYLSVGEEEVRKLRKRKSEAKTQPKRKNTPVNEQVAGSSRSNRLHKMGDTETILEHEEFMDDLLRKLRGDGCSTVDPFQIMETKVEKYPVHDEETHWRMRKPKVGEKFVDGQQLKECLTYYALANGFSLWFYRSSTNQIIAKCGQRPEELKDPSKGKQRCFNKYPSGDKRNDNTCPWRCYAWAIVNVKNKENWSWLLELLGEDLDLPTVNGLTLMSDQHKGLIEAVKDVMPNAEHRQCARHIYEGTL